MFNYITKDSNGYDHVRVGKVITHIVLAIIILIIIFGSFGTISAGDRGVKVHFGKVVGMVQPGLYFKAPIIEGVISMDVQTQKEAVTGVQAASQDLQTVKTDVTVNYHMEPQDVATMYQNVGLDYASRLIDPAIQESVKATTAKYTAEQLITHREQVRDDVIALLTSKFDQFNLKLDTVNITNFDFSATFNTAIEAKVTAQQNALAAENKLKQVQFEAQQTITSAEAQAKAIQIQAQAINSQGGADYVALQAISKWDGKLPVQMIPGSSVPFINVNAK